MDRASMIEQQLYNSQWLESQKEVYGKNVDYLNIYGTKDRLPMRNLQNSVIAHSRHPQSQRQMNVAKSRYTHPGGLTYDRRDFARVLNSGEKEHAGYIYHTSEATLGVWNAPVGSGWS